MAEVSIRGSVERVFFENKGFTVVEKTKLKSGDEKSERFTVWFPTPQSFAIGDVIGVKGLQSSKVAEFTGKDGQQKHIVELAINNPTLLSQAIPTPSEPVAPLDLPF